MYQCKHCGKTSFANRMPLSTDMKPCNEANGYMAHSWEKGAVETNTKVEKRVVVERVEQYKSPEQMLVEHQIDMERREEVRKSDEKFFQDMKKYWKIWVPLFIIAIAAFVYMSKQQHRTNQMKKDINALIGK